MDRRTSFDGRSVPAGSGADPRVAVVVLAGGSGLRVGGDRNKAYLPLGDHTAVGLSLQAMERATAPWLCRLILVIRNDDGELARQTLDDELPRPLVPVELVTGGSTRHGSEERALRHLADAVAAAEIDLVLIHDAARPLCSPALVGALVRAAAKYGGAVPGLDAADLAAVGDDGRLVPLTGRHVRVQTPQVFAAAPLLAAYNQAARTGFEGTDTSACIERFSAVDVVHVAGEDHNFKITYPHDLYVANMVVRRTQPRE